MDVQKQQPELLCPLRREPESVRSRRTANTRSARGKKNEREQAAE